MSLPLDHATRLGTLAGAVSVVLAHLLPDTPENADARTFLQRALDDETDASRRAMARLHQLLGLPPIYSGTTQHARTGD